MAGHGQMLREPDRGYGGCREGHCPRSYADCRGGSLEGEGGGAGAEAAGGGGEPEDWGGGRGEVIASLKARV